MCSKIPHWVTLAPFVADNPELIRNKNAAYHLSSNREHNGLAKAGACKKVPGIGVCFHPDRFRKWLESQS